MLQAEVEIYDQYLRGDVYGYVIEDEDEERLDSCGGFFGFDYCKEEAESSARIYAKKQNEELQAVFD